MPSNGAKWVYRFGRGAAEGRGDLRNLLGGKGAGLAEMSNLGLPVPPGFTITTEVCTHFYAHDKTYPPELEAQVAGALTAVERQIGAKFGDPAKPLLVSVRSGARARTNGDEQRLCRVAEFGADLPLDGGQGARDLGLQFGRIGFVVRVEMGADLGGDRETGRHGQPEIAHLGETRAL